MALMSSMVPDRSLYCPSIEFIRVCRVENDPRERSSDWEEGLVEWEMEWGMEGGGGLKLGA